MLAYIAANQYRVSQNPKIQVFTALPVLKKRWFWKIFDTEMLQMVLFETW